MRTEPMIRVLNWTLTALCALFFAAPGSAAGSGHGEDLWIDLDGSISKNVEGVAPVPQAFRTLRLDVEAMGLALSAVPPESLTDPTKQRSEGALLSLPLPEGGFEQFVIVESPIMAPGLASRYPDIRTYRGQSEDGVPRSGWI